MKKLLSIVMSILMFTTLCFTVNAGELDNEDTSNTQNNTEEVIETTTDPGKETEDETSEVKEEDSKETDEETTESQEKEETKEDSSSEKQEGEISKETTDDTTKEETSGDITTDTETETPKESTDGDVNTGDENKDVETDIEETTTEETDTTPLPLRMEMHSKVAKAPSLPSDDTDEGIEQADVAYVAKVNDKEYVTLKEAIEAANDGDTIYLYEGTFKSYNVVKTTKSLTFVGAGTDKTFYEIGYANAASPNEDSDNSFDGSNSITFQNLTLKGCTGNEQYHGFVRIKNITLENCVFEGGAVYWGINTTTFNNVTFKNAKKYNLWVYDGNTFNFNNCTFESTSGSFINVYCEVLSGIARTVNINNCIFNSTKVDKAAVNINDGSVNGTKPTDLNYTINFTGNNKFKGVNTEKTGKNQYFSYSKDNNNGYFTTVTINGKTVWEKGQATSNPIPSDTGNPTASLPSDQQKIEYKPSESEDKQIKFEDSSFTPSSDTSLDLKVNVDFDASTDGNGNSEVGNVDETIKETTETKIDEALKEGIKVSKDDDTTINSDTHEVSSYTYLDITLNATYTSGAETKSSNVTELPEDMAREITVALDDTTFDSVSTADLVKILRIHEDQKDLLDAILDKTTKTLRFTTNLFSTYVIVSFNTKAEDPKPSKPDDTDDSNNSSSNTDTNTRKAVSCEDAIGRNWTWSEKLGKCVYRVTNTSTD